MKTTLGLIALIFILIGIEMFFSFGEGGNPSENIESAIGLLLIFLGFVVAFCVSSFVASMFFSSYCVFVMPSWIAENWGFLTPNTLPDWVPWAFGAFYLGSIVLGVLTFQTTLILERLRLSYGLD